MTTPGWLPGVILPGERKAKRIRDKITFDLLTEELRTYSPKIIYCALLYWQGVYGYRSGWTHYCFVDIYGVPAKAKDRGKPVSLEDSRLEEWLNLRAIVQRRGKRWKSRRRGKID